MGAAGICTDKKKYTIAPQTVVRNDMSKGTINSAKDIIPPKRVFEPEISIARLNVYFESEKQRMNPKVISLFEAVIESQCESIPEITIRLVALGPEGGGHLAEVLPFFSHISTLKLWKSKLGPDGIKRIAQVDFRPFQKLTVLGLEDNLLGPTGVSLLCKALKGMRSLKELWLPINSMKTAGGKALAGVLPKLLSLEKLSVDENELENEGGKAILQACARVPRLIFLSLAFNNLTSSCISPILNFLGASSARRKVNITGNHFSENDEERIHEAIRTKTVSAA